MRTHNVAICDHIHGAGYEILREDNRINLFDYADCPKDELSDRLSEIEVAITRSSTPVDVDFLKHCKNLKAIVRVGVGVDHVGIDLCSAQGVVVMNVPKANTNAACELTLTHLLSSLRMFPYAHNALKNDRTWRRELWYGTELKGKKVGIIGFGNIGSAVATRIKSFEADVLTYDPYIQPTKATELGVDYTTNFNDILTCDIITLHIPKNRETLNIIDEKALGKMKKGAIIINCARGGLIDEQALYDNLKSGHIAFAGIDVFDQEPAIDHPLLELDNVCVTPHLGAYTKESQYNIAIEAAQQAIEAAKGIAYPNALNLPVDSFKVPSYLKAYFELVQKIAYVGFANLKNEGALMSARLEGYGEVSKLLEALEVFMCVGVLKSSLGDQINYLNAKHIAQSRDIKITNGILKGNFPYRNMVRVILKTQNKTFSICGSIFDKDNLRIVDVNGYNLDIEPKGRFILYRNTDVPGVIGDLGNILANYNVNIADFRLSRQAKGALSIIVVDNEPSFECLKELSNLPACLDLNYVNI